MILCRDWHLSFELWEYIVLPLDYTAILGLRFGGYPVSTEFVDFDIASELLSIHYPFTQVMRQYFGPIEEP